MGTVPSDYVEWLNANRYHPRSNKHGAALCRLVLHDLMQSSELLSLAKKKGILVYDEDHNMFLEESSELTWNADLVIGLRNRGHFSVADKDLVRDSNIDNYLFAMDAKGIMTEHGKARRNRQRDLVAFSQVMRAFYPNIITAGVLPINSSKRFDSPLRDSDPIDHPKNISEIVDGTIELFRAIRVQQLPSGENPVDAVRTFVIDFSNVSGEQGTLANHSINDENSSNEVSYASFRRGVVELIEERYGELIRNY